MKPYAPRSRPRLGPWFHSFNKDGGLDRQGKILSELQPGIYLVQLYSWATNAPLVKKVIALADMSGWSFFRANPNPSPEEVNPTPPGRFFLRIVTALIRYSHEKAHIADPRRGGLPAVAAPPWWGWAIEDGPDGARWFAHGPCLGWLAPGDNLYLLPAALAVAQAALTPIASAKLAAMTVPGLARALDREGYLVTSNRAGRGVYTVRRRIKGRWREVFHLRAGRAADGPIAVPVAPHEVPAEEESPFPRRVARLRKRLGGISADELARRLGVDPATVRSWEAGLHAPQPANHRALLRLEGQWRREFNAMCAREEPKE